MRAAPRAFPAPHLANLVNEAALNAARYNRKTVAMNDFEGAKDKVLMGKERKSMVITEKREEASLPTTKPAMPWWPT